MLPIAQSRPWKVATTAPTKTRGIDIINAFNRVMCSVPWPVEGPPPRPPGADEALEEKRRQARETAEFIVSAVNALAEKK